MTIDEVVGTNVHRLMWDRRIKRPAVCQALGISTSALSKKMRGEVAWSASDIAKAAEVLCVDPGRLFVAGAGFEPATSGLRAWNRPEAARPALIIPFPRRSQTGDDPGRPGTQNPQLLGSPGTQKTGAGPPERTGSPCPFAHPLDINLAVAS